MQSSKKSPRETPGLQTKMSPSKLKDNLKETWRSRFRRETKILYQTNCHGKTASNKLPPESEEPEGQDNIDVKAEVSRIYPEHIRRSGYRHNFYYSAEYSAVKKRPLNFRIDIISIKNVLD